jgi:hypothetical protein
LHFQVLTQILAADEFWAQHMPTMSAAAKAQHGQEAGVSGSFLSDIKPQAGLKFCALMIIYIGDSGLGFFGQCDTIESTFLFRIGQGSQDKKNYFVTFADVGVFCDYTWPM